jgi:hypothetical protein
MATTNGNNDRWLDPESLEEIELTYQRLRAGDTEGVVTEMEESIGRVYDHLEAQNPGYERPNTAKVDLDAADHPNSVELEGHDS